MTKPRLTTFEYISGKKYDGMMGRCYRTTDKSYSSYGGRGIKVAGEWIRNINSFRMFLLAELTRINVSVETLLDNPKQYQLDRIDVNGHYSPTNCRLVSPQENTRNRRISSRATVVSAEGETICLG